MAVSVDASTVNPLPVTPAAPFEVTMSMPRMVSISPVVSCTLYNCARKMAAMER
jgi:hypothetical protein